MKKLFYTIFTFALIAIVAFTFSSCSNKNVITFNTNGGSNIEKVIVKRKDVIYLHSPTKTGYNFVNWYEDNNTFEILFNPRTLEGNITVYAKWEAKTYKINYELNGGQLENSPATYTYNQPLTLPTPEKESYTFAGWFKTEDFTGESITQIVAGTLNSITLYAKWL